MSKLYNAKLICFGLLVTLLSSLLLLSCGATKVAEANNDEALTRTQAGDEEGGQTLVALRERGALKVGLSTFHPWAMQDAKGQWIGFEVNVAKKLTEDLGLKLELVPTAWAGIIPALLTGKFDIIIGGMSVTPKRAEQVTFSIPYEYNKTVLLLDRNIQVSSMEELNNPKYRFVGRAGSTPYNLTQELFPQAQTKAFDDEGLSLQDLLNGQADGFMTTSVEASIHIEEHASVIYVPKWAREVKKEDAAFAMPKDAEQAWVDYINQWIQEHWDNGFLEEQSRYWFETRDWVKDHELAQ
ncbi:transporter substrate-binding domain-containing protein [Candidatus Haliotispira prima]|uniref:Transporter substrate-binding domain-containing protein n=1 Tax=Candidatus Haliotispira prima TaxID=3034016 RepID=A0ABY8MG95_9SPIO|nr:transporter substrate-binding domain-containing protein [Candidatus Haliotispira prima]